MFLFVVVGPSFYNWRASLFSTQHAKYFELSTLCFHYSKILIAFLKDSELIAPKVKLENRKRLFMFSCFNEVYFLLSREKKKWNKKNCEFYGQPQTKPILYFPNGRKKRKKCTRQLLVFVFPKDRSFKRTPERTEDW